MIMRYLFDYILILVYSSLTTWLMNAVMFSHKFSKFMNYVDYQDYESTLYIRPVQQSH